MGKNLKYAAMILGITLLLWLAANFRVGFAEWYATKIFPFFPHVLGRVFSLLPVSAGEILLLLLAFSAIFLLLFARHLVLRLLRAMPLFAACLLLVFMLGCGLNYQRASIALYLGLETRPYSARELSGLYEILAAQAHELSALPQRDTMGQPQISRQELHRAARLSMESLSQICDGLAGYYPNPKPLLLSQGMSRLNLSGIYSPFTIEANYNSHMPLLAQPFTICHELAHLGGYSREDEANFIAYLACAQSENAAFRYSGNFQALIYVLNALRPLIDKQEYARLYALLPAQTVADLRDISAYWQQFEGRAAEISETVNNAYLKANSQPEGTQSYGRMVDLLLAYYGI